jgi:hypothetical protein
MTVHRIATHIHGVFEAYFTNFSRENVPLRNSKKKEKHCEILRMLLKKQLFLNSFLAIENFKKDLLIILHSL